MMQSELDNPRLKRGVANPIEGKDPQKVKEQILKFLVKKDFFLSHISSPFGEASFGLFWWMFRMGFMNWILGRKVYGLTNEIESHRMLFNSLFGRENNSPKQRLKSLLDDENLSWYLISRTKTQYSLVVGVWCSDDTFRGVQTLVEFTDKQKDKLQPLFNETIQNLGSHTGYFFEQ